MTMPIYRKGMRNPDTTSAGVGILDFNAAIRAGVDTANAIQRAKLETGAAIIDMQSKIARMPAEIQALEENAKTAAIKHEIALAKQPAALAKANYEGKIAELKYGEAKVAEHSAQLEKESFYSANRQVFEKFTNEFGVSKADPQWLGSFAPSIDQIRGSKNDTHRAIVSRFDQARLENEETAVLAERKKIHLTNAPPEGAESKEDADIRVLANARSEISATAPGSPEHRAARSEASAAERRLRAREDASVLQAENGFREEALHAANGNKALAEQLYRQGKINRDLAAQGQISILQAEESSRRIAKVAGDAQQWARQLYSTGYSQIRKDLDGQGFSDTQMQEKIESEVSKRLTEFVHDMPDNEKALYTAAVTLERLDKQSKFLDVQESNISSIEQRYASVTGKDANGQYVGGAHPEKQALLNQVVRNFGGIDIENPERTFDEAGVWEGIGEAVLDSLEISLTAGIPDAIEAIKGLSGSEVSSLSSRGRITNRNSQGAIFSSQSQIRRSTDLEIDTQIARLEKMSRYAPPENLPKINHKLDVMRAFKKKIRFGPYDVPTGVESDVAVLLDAYKGAVGATTGYSGRDASAMRQSLRGLKSVFNRYSVPYEDIAQSIRASRQGLIARRRNVESERDRALKTLGLQSETPSFAGNEHPTASVPVVDDPAGLNR